MLCVLSRDDAQLWATAIAASAFCTLCSPGIGRLMLRQPRFLIGAPVDDAHIEMRGAFRKTDIVRPYIGLGIEPTSDEAPVLDASHHRLHFGMIETKHREPVERHIFHEALEGFAHAVELP